MKQDTRSYAQRSEYMRKYHKLRRRRMKENNPEKLQEEDRKRNETRRQWARTENGKVFCRNVRNRRRARLAGQQGGGLTREDFHFVFSASAGSCVYCGSVATSIDHVVPISRGGRDDLSNVVACCVFCNSSKGGRLIQEWPRARKLLEPEAYAFLVRYTNSFPVEQEAA